jgi:DNA repair protein RadD
VTHSKELITQNYNTLKRYSNVDGVGIYSAGLDSAEVGKSVTYGTIQTIYRNLNKLPKQVDVIIIDEAHWVSHKGTDSKMYNALIAHYPEARLIGLSATPYRLDKGLIYEGEGCHFDHLAIEISVLELVREGFLSPLVGLSVKEELNLKGVHKTGGDFDTKEVDERITEAWMEEVLGRVAKLAASRRAILLFAPTVRAAEMAAKYANKAGISAEYVHGGDKERDDRLARWEAGDFKLMANCAILTTGYDRPDIDCVVDLAPTESLGKHVQKLGRGTRLFEGKENCLVIDAVGNLLRLGGVVVGLEEMHQESQDGTIEKIPATPRKKPEARKTKTAGELSDLDPMIATSKGLVVNVSDCRYVVISSRTHHGKKLVLASYTTHTDNEIELECSQFIMPEYTGWAYQETVKWFERRGEASVPYSAEAARIKAFGLPIPRQLRIRKQGKYFNVLEEIF